MNWNKRPTIGLFGEANDSQHKRLFAALRSLFDAEFCVGAGAAPDSLAAQICFGPKSAKDAQQWSQDLPSFCADEGIPPETISKIVSIQLESSIELPQGLRGQDMSEEEFADFSPVEQATGDEVLASVSGRPVWVQNKTGPAYTTRVGIAPPKLGESGCLLNHFRAGRFMRVLPLIVFLRQIIGTAKWDYPTRGACFLMDDPSLYSQSYGYVNFRQLAEHARAHDYCVAIATVPLDLWRLNPAVIEIFRQHAQHLSLIPHGNDHLKCELARPTTEDQTLRMLAQALRRLERLERQGGLEVCRVMEPPHAALGTQALRPLRRLGYEAVFQSSEKLIDENPGIIWPAHLGLGPSDFLDTFGFTGIRRIRMTRDWKEDVRLTGVLDQPIVVGGHSTDAMGGMELLAEFADLMRQLGGTKASPGRIARSNYMARRHHGTLHLRMNSQRIALSIPPGVEEVWVYRPWIEQNPEAEVLNVVCGGKTSLSSDCAGAMAGPFSVSPSAIFEAWSRPQDLIDPRTVPAPRRSLWPVFRKILMEVRDRTGPLRRVKRQHFDK